MACLVCPTGAWLTLAGGCARPDGALPRFLVVRRIGPASEGDSPGKHNRPSPSRIPAERFPQTKRDELQQIRDSLVLAWKQAFRNETEALAHNPGTSKHRRRNRGSDLQRHGVINECQLSQRWSHASITRNPGTRSPKRNASRFEIDQLSILSGEKPRQCSKHGTTGFGSQTMSYRNLFSEQQTR
jgi:hypothetical protein